MPVSLLEIPAEISSPIAVNLRIHQLNFVQHVADLSGSQGRVIQKIDEIIERLLEVDIVFPERVVGIENEPRVFRRPHSIPATPPPCPLRGATAFTRWTRFWRIT